MITDCESTVLIVTQKDKQEANKRETLLVVTGSEKEITCAIANAIDRKPQLEDMFIHAISMRRIRIMKSIFNEND